MRPALALVAAMVLAPADGVPAATLEMPPSAAQAAERVESYGSLALATAPWRPEGMPQVSLEGQVRIEAWQVPTGSTTLQLLAPLREQLADQGYEVIFECEAARCGGFDFRYASEVLPEPEMHVDLADFRYLAAERAGVQTELVGVLVSRTSSTGYVQIARVGPPEMPPAEVELISKSPDGAAAPETSPEQPQGAEASTLAAMLEAVGRVTLGDLSFETGSSRLAESEFLSLAALAEYLTAHPERKVTLVGHTDAEGSLSSNVALSRARARAVRLRLIESFGVTPSQLEADGVGYLMPLASNLTDEGRTLNRRVEAVLTSID